MKMTLDSNSLSIIPDVSTFLVKLNKEIGTVDRTVFQRTSTGFPLLIFYTFLHYSLPFLKTKLIERKRKFDCIFRYRTIMNQIGIEARNMHRKKRQWLFHYSSPKVNYCV